MNKKLISVFVIISLILSSCHFISSFTEKPGNVQSVSFDKNTVEIAIGQMDIISLKIKAAANQKNLSISWEYDKSVIVARCDNYGAVITGVKSGNTLIKAVVEGKTAVCSVRVTSNNQETPVKHPYVYVSSDFVSVSPTQTAKVYASLYGMPQVDINGFSFTIDKPAIASIHTEGNYCWITGKTEGMAKITAKHTKSPYSYTFLVSCTASNLNIPYITSSENIVTINRQTEPEKSVTVDMVNAPYPTYKDDFVFTVVDESGNDISLDSPITITKEGAKVKISAQKEGFCYIRVTHASCVYSFDILCRVVENIDTVYIEPSASYVELHGANAQTVSVSLKNLPEGITENPDEYEWNFSENAEQYIDYTVFGGSKSGKGNSIWLSGKKSGSVKITVSHKSAASAQTMLVLIKDITEESSSSKVYITTNQNYIETKVGAESIRINITLNNLSPGDENNITWTIANKASDGSNDNVIVYETGTGQAVRKSASVRRRRSLIPMTDGYALITPVKEGTATISISHPKAAYPTTVMVNVLSGSQSPSKKFSLSSNKPLVSILNGQTETVEVSLTGIGKTPADENDITWQVSDPTFSLSVSGKTAQINANGTGSAKATLSITHPLCTHPLEIALIRADNEKKLHEVKTIYTASNSYTVYTGKSVQLSVTGTNLDENDRFTWSCDEGLSDIYSLSEHGNIAIINALKAGIAQIKVTLNSTGDNLTFYIHVKQSGIVEEDKPCYLTTRHNTVTLTKGSQKEVSVTPVNIATDSYIQTVWQNNNPELFELQANDTSATISAQNEGHGTITISHPLSKNKIVIQVHVGNEYIHHNTDIAYISTEKDTIILKTDSADTMLSCVLSHTESSETSLKGFTFTSLQPKVFKVNYSPANNYCMITPLKAGQGILKIHHPDAAFDKEVVVIVEKSKEQLGAIPYLSTKQNVITVVEGEYVSASVTLENVQNYNTSSWTWASENNTICDVVTNNGNTAMISGITAGTTKIKVTHKDCKYPLELIVLCLDSAISQSSPWIKVSNNIVNLKTRGSFTVTAEMIGGSSTDESSFVWTINDSSIALASGAGSSCYIRALRPGFTYISCRNTQHPNAYVKTIYVRVEDTVEDACYISVLNKIIKMNPSSQEGTTITANLVNGTPLDSQDFIWWADNNALVRLITNADTCTVIPTGVAGSTTIHVKHPKVLQPLDIIVMLSKYDTFAFADESKQISEKSIQFVSMKIPATDGKALITYQSENPNVCAITGSNETCMIAGVSPGYTKVSATLTSNSSVIATAEMAVIVSRKEEAVNTISMNSTILTLKTGEGKTLEALLAGNDISAVDNYNIRWQCNNPDVISLLATENNDTKGKNAYIKAKSPGEAVITVSHPKCQFDLQLWVLVPKQEEVSLTLSDTYVEMYKGDGAKVIKATVINGTAADENAITWTAAKVGGVNIISISKATGKTCNIMPRSTGSTTLRAQLPNGNYADCIVTVLSNAQIVLETQAVHVNPGYSETVRYTTVPENAAINWLSLFNGGSGGFSGSLDYFSFYVNEAAKTITVTGNKLGSGTIKGYITSNTGSALASLAVYVEYNYELELKNAGVIQTQPRKDAIVEIPFHVYPKNMQITTEVSDPTVLEVKSISLDETTGEGTVFVKPLKEGLSQTVTVIATNPNDLVRTPLKKKQIINSRYEQLTITPVFDFAAGTYSYFDGDDANPTLYLGDGEDVVFYLDIAEENATVDNITVTYASNSGINDFDSQIYTQEDKIYDEGHNQGKVSENRHHIFFSGSENATNPARGTLSAESVNTAGKKLYRIGHNYDYKKESGYVVKGKYKFPYKITFWQGTFKFWYENSYKPAWWKPTHYMRHYRGYIKNNEADWILRDNLLSYMKNRATKLDDNYYWIEQGDFELNKNFRCELYCEEEKDWLTWDGRNWLGGENPAPSWVTKTFTMSVNDIVYPGKWTKNDTTKNDSIAATTYGRITISYKDSSEKLHAINFNVAINKRYCEKSTKGYWKKDSIDGITAWKMIKTTGFNEENLTETDYAFFSAEYEQLQIKKGEIKTITITTNNSTLFNNAAWSIEDTDIATVTGDKTKAVIKGLKNGYTTVKVAFKDRENRAEERSISVKVVEPILFADFVMDESQSYNIKNNEVSLAFTSQLISPEDLKKTVFISNNPKIKITDVSFSDTKVTIKIKAEKGFSTAEITIKNPVVETFSITLKDKIET